MNKEIFWDVINYVNREIDSNDRDAVYDATRAKLLQFSSQEITAWKSIQTHYSKLADTDEVYASALAINDYVSGDGFMDFRMWLISKGREVYMNALKDPDSLVDVEVEKGKAYFEEYSYVANDAYRRKCILERVGIDKIYNTLLDELVSNGKDNIKELVEKMDFIGQINAHDIKSPLNKGLYAFIEDMLCNYDIYNEMDKHPLTNEMKNEIQSEIEYAPSVMFNKDKFHEIVPNLYEKMHNDSQDFDLNM